MIQIYWKTLLTRHVSYMTSHTAEGEDKACNIEGSMARLNET